MPASPSAPSRRGALQVARPDEEAPPAALEKALGITIKNKKLLLQALTHTSYAAEHGTGNGEDYERLEFLGDGILNMVTTAFLYQRYPDADEGRMSALKSHLVSQPSLVSWAKPLHLGRYLLVSKGENRTGGRDRPSMLADVLEAVIAAVYLDQGLPTAERLITRWLAGKRVKLSDYKSKMQEVVQKEHRIQPDYRTVGESGPQHEKIFEVEVRVKGKTLGRGAGKTKKEAEQQAARDALRKRRAE